MKKTLKSLALIVTMGLVLVSLAGCGSNKLVATKTTEDPSMGNYKEEIVMTFKNDKVDTIKMTMEFDNEETAETMYSLYSFGLSMSEEESIEGMDVKLDGKKFIITMDASTYAESEGVSDEEMTRETLKKALEEDGYTVK